MTPSGQPCATKPRRAIQIRLLIQRELFQSAAAMKPVRFGFFKYLISFYVFSFFPPYAPLHRSEGRPQHRHTLQIEINIY